RFTEKPDKNGETEQAHEQGGFYGAFVPSSGRNVLVTGGTGFMGKVLIEKMLYSIPDIGNIYILIRPKKGKSVAQRLEDMQRLPDFGISSSEIDKLSTEISVVFHFAATLRLEAPLKDNVNMNTSGTQRAINVAKQLKNLVIFAPPAKPENVMRLTEWLDDRQLALITPSLLGPHANCYTFSKRLAENVVEQAYPDLPIVIALCPAVNEPIPGWVDSLNGPVGVMIGAGKGVIRTMLCDGRYTAQYGRKAPLEWPLWYPNGDITSNATLHEFRRIFYHLLPAFCIDFLMFLLGQKRFLYVLDWVVKILFWLFVLSFLAAWFGPIRSVLQLGGPVIKHLPFLGPAVFKN
ncbi:Fatty acyl-CoA reductase 1, partial [Operophtera brumata]